MSNVNSLITEEAHRVAQHESMKDQVRDEVQSEISAYASEPNQGEPEKAAVIGQEIRHKAFDEVAMSEAELDRARSAARISQIVDFAFYVIYSLIGLQILLDLLGARRGNGFRALIDTLTAPILGPFESLIQSIGLGRFQLKLSYLFAFVVYLLLHAGINALLRIFAERKTSI